MSASVYLLFILIVFWYPQAGVPVYMEPITTYKGIITRGFNNQKHITSSNHVAEADICNTDFKPRLFEFIYDLTMTG